MAWLVVDKNNTEWVLNCKPFRSINAETWNVEFDEELNPIGSAINLPKGTIEKIIGRKLTWEDEPVEIK